VFSPFKNSSYLYATHCNIQKCLFHTSTVIKLLMTFRIINVFFNIMNRLFLQERLSVKFTVFWDVMLYSLEDTYCRFKLTCRIFWNSKIGADRSSETFEPTKLQVITIQKFGIFIVSAVSTWNLTEKQCFLYGTNWNFKCYVDEFTINEATSHVLERPGKFIISLIAQLLASRHDESKHSRDRPSWHEFSWLSSVFRQLRRLLTNPNCYSMLLINTT
jgi:hypothetical protein